MTEHIARAGANALGQPIPLGGRQAHEQTWRRSGEPLYAALAFAVFAAQAAALGLASWALLFRRGAVVQGALGIRNVLVGAVTLAAACLAVVTASVVTFRSISARQERRHAEELAAWAATWGEVLDGKIDCPPGPLPSAAIAALLELREEAVGARAEEVGAVISGSGVERVLLERLGAVSKRSRRRWSFHLPGGSSRLAVVLDLLDDVARARIAAALPHVLSLAGRPEPAVRTMAIRAASRTIAAMRPGPERVAAAIAMLGTLSPLHLGRVALDRALLLLEDAATPLIGAVLHDPSADTALVSSCLDSAGRLGLSELAPEIGSHVDGSCPVEVRAAALRALASLSTLPDLASDDLRAALSDPLDVVRTQAARAAYLLPPDEAVPALEELLGDRGWWVRRAAGESLARVPRDGAPALCRAATEHPDQFARDMAAQVLRDHRISVPPFDQAFRETA